MGAYKQCCVGRACNDILFSDFCTTEDDFENEKAVVIVLLDGRRDDANSNVVDAMIL